MFASLRKVFLHSSFVVEVSAPTTGPEVAEAWLTRVSASTVHLT